MTTPWLLELIDEEAVQTQDPLPGIHVYRFQRGGDPSIECYAQTEVEHLFADNQLAKKALGKAIKNHYKISGHGKPYYKMKIDENRDHFQRCFSNNATNGKCVVPTSVVTEALRDVSQLSEARQLAIRRFIKSLSAKEKEMIATELAGSGDGSGLLSPKDAGDAAAAAAANGSEAPVTCVADSDWHKRKRSSLGVADVAPDSLVSFEFIPPAVTAAAAAAAFAVVPGAAKRSHLERRPAPAATAELSSSSSWGLVGASASRGTIVDPQALPSVSSAVRGAGIAFSPPQSPALPEPKPFKRHHAATASDTTGPDQHSQQNPQYLIASTFDPFGSSDSNMMPSVSVSGRQPKPRGSGKLERFTARAVDSLGDAFESCGLLHDSYDMPMDDAGLSRSRPSSSSSHVHFAAAAAALAASNASARQHAVRRSEELPLEPSTFSSHDDLFDQPLFDAFGADHVSPATWMLQQSAPRRAPRNGVAPLLSSPSPRSSFTGNDESNTFQVTDADRITSLAKAHALCLYAANGLRIERCQNNPADFAALCLTNFNKVKDTENHACPRCCENFDMFDPHGKSCISAGTTALMMFATTFVMIQTPAMGIAQAGSIKRKNALSMLMQTLTGLCVGSVLWFVLGYSLTFGTSRGGFIGWSSEALFLRGLPLNGCIAGQEMPSLLYATFQMMFALMVPVIVTGAWAEKMTFRAFLVFITAWPILVYYPLAHWVWGGGFLASAATPALDFAGGITIHTTSGVAAFTVSWFLARRKPSDHIGHHNLPMTIIGGTLIWAGWYSFNGGSAFVADAQAGTALLNTHISACASGMVWTLMMFYSSKPRQWHLTGIMNGALAGLAGITPGSGFVEPWAAFIIGIIVGICSLLSVRFFKGVLHLDDVLDVTSLQGVPGMLGSILLGFFACPSVHPGAAGVFYSLDNFSSGTFLGMQVGAVVLAAVWSGFFTALIMMFMKSTVGIDVSPEDEEKGLDLAQIGEQAYDDSLDAVLDLGAAHVQMLVCEAAAAGSLQEIERLTRGGGSLTTGDYDGRTPLHLAASEGRLHVVIYLVEVHHVPINPKDNMDRTPLMDAISNKKMRIVDYLRKHGAEADDDALIMQLFDAASLGDVKESIRLVRCGALVDSQDYDLRTPLMVAASEGHLDVVLALLDNGASPNARDRWQRTALDDAKKFGHADVVAALQDKTNAIEVEPNSGWDADEVRRRNSLPVSTLAPSSIVECCAAAARGDVDELKRLSQKNANVTLADYDGRTPLHLASGHGHHDAVTWLLEQRGIKVNAKDRWGQTPLSEAQRNDEDEVASLLKQAGATTINKVVGHTLCKLACRGDLKGLKRELSHGANVNIADYDGRTALHLAASEGWTDVVRWLLKNGANPKATDRHGFNALDDAMRHGHANTVAVIRDPSAAVGSDRSERGKEDEHAGEKIGSENGEREGDEGNELRKRNLKVKGGKLNEFTPLLSLSVND